MAAIAASDVSYSFSVEDVKVIARVGKHVIATISFGDDTLTYPTGGVPVDAKKLWGERTIKSLKVLESSASGFVYEFDVSAQKIVILQAPEQDGDAEVAKPLEVLGASETPNVDLVCELIVD